MKTENTCQKLFNGFVFHNLILPLVFVVFFICTSFQNETSGAMDGLMGPTDEDGFVLLIGLVVWIVGFYLVRRRVIKFFQKQMMEVSEHEKRDQFIDGGLPEQPADSQPVLMEINSQQVSEKQIKKAIGLREKLVAKASNLWKKKLWFGILACAGYLVLPLLVEWTMGKDIINSATYKVVFIFTIIYLILIVLQFLLFSKQFRAKDAKFKSNVESPYLSLIRKIARPRAEQLFFYVLIFWGILLGIMELTGEPLNESAKTSTSMGFALIAAASFHFLLFYNLRKNAFKTLPLKLLILRVFGKNENSKFTFLRLLRFWKHIGSSFTVMDPSFLYNHYRSGSMKGIKMFIRVFFIMILLSMGLALIIDTFKIEFGNLSGRDLGIWGFIPSAGLAWLFYWLYWKQQVQKGFAKNLESIQKQLVKLEKKPRNWDLSFKNLPLSCYDNTWKLAVGSFVNKSDAVLMDLRGYSMERRGCEYEVNFIIDTFPVSGIVFLVDSQNDKKLVHEMILQKWEEQWIESPNIKLKKPMIRVFISEKEDEIDLQFLMDLLIEAAHSTKGEKKPIIPEWT